MKRNLILAPGPTQVPSRLCDVLGKPIIHHRTPQFQGYLKEVIEGLQYVLQTKNDICLMASSGTGAMEASVCSILSPGDKVITVEGGKFGERWTELCKAYGVEAQVMDVEWGKAVDPAAIKEALGKDKEIKAVFVTLCETSTGVTADIEAIGEVVKQTDAVLVADAVSGLGVTDLQTDNWAVDLVASASHKGLMLPPGVAFVSISEKAKALIEKSTSPSYYFDLRKYLKSATKTDTPFTPAIGVVIALSESLKMIKEAGIDNLFKHYERLAKGTRAAMEAIGLTLFADESCISNVLTSVNVPDGVDGVKLVKTMRDTHGITMAGGQAQLKGKIFRMAHMGSLDEYDVLTGIACIEKTLNSAGYKFNLGDGVAAAQKVFNS
ncbi:MAG: alanine--glyoxylate aminotransferase family protein [Candidatus Omnitrophica bacterium]|nr:alanine--glyoxylate aminotransferase family protein [Candidatus Omnitrophota bacterium]